MARPRKATNGDEQTSSEESEAQAEFARYKERMAQAGGGGFASPLRQGAIPVWSLQPQLAGGGARHSGWVSGSQPSSGTPSLAQGVGTTLRLGVDALNAALSRSIQLMNAWSEADECGCGCCDLYACDCCIAMGCGCGCGCGCEPSVGSCC